MEKTDQESMAAFLGRVLTPKWATQRPTLGEATLEAQAAIWYAIAMDLRAEVERLQAEEAERIDFKRRYESQLQENLGLREMVDKLSEDRTLWRRQAEEYEKVLGEAHRELVEVQKLLHIALNGEAE